MTAIALTLLLIAENDVAEKYAEIQPQNPDFVCIEFHTDDPLNADTPRVSLNFTRPSGGQPVQWHLYPFRHIEEEELVVGARRVTFPVQ